MRVPSISTCASSRYVKSNLGQQVPAANGAAYAMKLMKKDQCAITYFGEGCASEGDIPSALNIAAVHGCPTIFFCRNNGYAISTHSDEQVALPAIAPPSPHHRLPPLATHNPALHSPTARITNAPPDVFGCVPQYKSDGIAPRGIAFGMPSIRVDGNDLLAGQRAWMRGNPMRPERREQSTR